MTRCLFFVEAGIKSARWTQAFPDAEFSHDPTSTSSVASGDLCWIMSSLPDWVDHTQRFSSQGARVVVISLVESRKELLIALGAGGRGYIHALTAANNLKSVAITVSSGGFWLGSSLVQELVANAGVLAERQKILDKPEQVPALTRLTAREREVCDLVATGLSNKEVARKIFVTERTVKAHLGAVFEKLQIRDRLQLALLIRSEAGKGAPTPSPIPASLTR